MGKMIIIKGATYTAPGEGGGTSSTVSKGPITFTRLVPNDGSSDWQLSPEGQLVVNRQNAFWCSDLVNIPVSAIKVKGPGSCFMAYGISGANNTAAMAFYDSEGNVLKVVNRVTTVVGTAGPTTSNYWEWGEMLVDIPAGASTMRVSFQKLSYVPTEYSNGEGFVFI